jgi:photosystem II stability/assembly factor-like uncharacterized protein
MNSRLTILCFAACLGSILYPSVTTAQKNQNPTNPVQTTENPTLEPSQTAHAWLRPPYLTVPVGEATVSDFVKALQQFDNDHKADRAALRQDENYRRFQRQVYQWQITGQLDQVPASHIDRLASLNRANTQPQTENAPPNPEGNWRLVGPEVDPTETGYSIEGVSNNEAVLTNTGIGRVTCVEFSRWNARNIWVGTASGGLWKSWDGGTTWTNISLSLPIMEITEVAIDPQNENVVFIATGDRDGSGGWYGKGTRSNLFKTTDGGNTWTQVLGAFNGSGYIEHLWMHPKSGNQLVIVKANGIFRTEDGGANWTRVLSTTPFLDGLTYADAAACASSGAECIYAGYFESNMGRRIFRVYRSDDFGNSWYSTGDVSTKINNADFKAQHVRMATAPSDPGCVYIVSSEFDTTAKSDRFGVLFRTLDGGRTWEDKGSYPSVPNLLGRYLGKGDDITSSGNYALMVAVDPTDKDRVYVSGTDMWGSKDGGFSFTKATFWMNSLGESAHGEHHIGKFQPTSRAFYLATEGGLYRTEAIQLGRQAELEDCYTPLSINAFRANCASFSTRWTFASNGISNSEFYGIAVSKSNGNFVMGGADGNGVIMRKGGRWQGAFGGDGTGALIHPRDTNTFYVSIGGGALYKTINGGKTYRYISRIMDSLDGGTWVTPMDISEANPNFIIQARNKNVWRTLNGGTNWIKMSNFPQGNAINLTHAVAVAPSSTNVVFVSRTTLDSGRTIQRYLWRTDNSGLEWVNVFDPIKFPADGTITDIAISANDPDKIWVTFSVGYAINPSQSKKVFASSDGGATWTNITDGLPDAPIWTIAVDDRSVGESIYVGTSIGVYYRDNITNRFVEWQMGMPKGLTVSDLKVHEGSGKVYAGTFGRGIWVAEANEVSSPAPENQALRTASSQNNNLKVSPNPTRGLISISLKINDLQTAQLDVTDLSGKSVYSLPQFGGTATCDLSHLANGIYFVKVKTEKELLVQKLILSK